MLCSSSLAENLSALALGVLGLLRGVKIQKWRRIELKHLPLAKKINISYNPSSLPNIQKMSPVDIPEIFLTFAVFVLLAVVQTKKIKGAKFGETKFYP